MSKKIKVILSVLSLVLIIVSSFIIFKFLNKNKLEDQVILDSNPVASEENLDVKHLSFTLPVGTLVESNYKGAIANISRDVKIFEDKDDDTEVQLVFIRVDENFLVEYTIIGDLLVEMGDLVDKGSELAKVRNGELKMYGGANLVIEAFDKDNNIVSLSK